jgi:RNA polymerase sigma-70 factor (ECF subfamily)
MKDLATTREYERRLHEPPGERPMIGRGAKVAREVTTASDAELMAQLALGEIGALGELYDRHHVSVRRFIVRATSDAEDVDDLVHQTFLTAAQSAGRYDGRAACRPWLVGIAVMLLRRRRHAFGRLFEVLSSLQIGRRHEADPRSRLQARGDVERALSRLSEAKRVTLLLAEVEGLSGPEIAEMLGVPLGTVWTRLHAARRELRAVLAEGEES